MNNNGDDALPGPYIFSPKQISQLTGLGLSTLARMRMQGTGIPYVKLGPHRVGYTQDALIKYLADNTVG